MRTGHERADQDSKRGEPAVHVVTSVSQRIGGPRELPTVSGWRPTAAVPNGRNGSDGMTAEALRRGMRSGSVSALSVGAFPLRLLIVESDGRLLQPLMEVGQAMGFTVQTGTPDEIASDLASGLGVLHCDVVLLDLSQDVARLNLLRMLRERFPRVPILVTTAFACVQTAVDALRHGASDFLTKPFSLEELTTTLQVAAERRSFDVELRRLQHQVRTSPALQEAAAASPAMQKLLSMVTRVAVSQHPVMVLGESGSGKERICRMLHSARMVALQATAPGSGELPFLHVDCAATIAAGLASELFGSVRDEGTSAREEKAGVLTVEGGGTLFLDEIDSLSLELQGKLLRALQDKVVRPTGSAMARPVTVRVVASSSRDLPALVERGAFRKDLYFKLNVVNLRVPPLRQRREDIPLLAAVFLERCSRSRNLGFSLDPDAMRALLDYEWPGNVREMEAVIERACSVSSGPVLHAVDLPTQLQQVQAEEDALRIDLRSAARPAAVPVQANRGTIEPIAEMERRVILSTLDKLNGDKLMTAKLLGIGKTTLYRKLKEYGVAEPVS